MSDARLLKEWHQVGATLQQAFEQHAEQLGQVREGLREVASQFTVAQLGIGSLGTQLDEAEKRVMRRVDTLERKLDAMLRAAGLRPEEYAND